MASNALVKRPSAEDSQLMPPRPTKRIKRPAKVLDEDTYTDALSHIITRDFFPGLLETQTQQEYLEALESENSEWIASAGRKLAEIMTPGPGGRRARGRAGTSFSRRVDQTPMGFMGDTPMSVASDAATQTTEGATKPNVDTNLSLSAFQAKYTSEDNESFNALLDKHNQKRAEKYAWMWAGNKIPAPRQIAHRAREAKLLEARGATKEGPLSIEAANKDDRKAMPDAWKVSDPANSLMFSGKDGIEDGGLQTVQQRAEAESRAPPKAVAYDNTRMPPPPAPATSDVPPSPSMSAVRDAISGRPRATDSEPGFGGGETPRVNGYSFVDDAPSPSPNELGAPPLTWGTLERTPLLLGESIDKTPNPFKIREQSKREDLHHRLVEKVKRSKRQPSSSDLATQGETQTPKFMSSPRVGAGNLTPAAQRLLSRVGTSRPGAAGAFDARVSTTVKPAGSSLRHRWTPTPRAQRKLE